MFYYSLGFYFPSFLKRAAQFLSPLPGPQKGNPSALGSQIPDPNPRSRGKWRWWRWWRKGVAAKWPQKSCFLSISASLFLKWCGWAGDLWGSFSSQVHESAAPNDWAQRLPRKATLCWPRIIAEKSSHKWVSSEISGYENSSQLVQDKLRG